MEHARAQRRRTRIVDGAAQTRVVLGITVLPLAVLIVAALVMWFLSARLFDEAQEVAGVLPSLGWLVMAQWVFVVSTGAVVVMQAFDYSYRVIGPAYRISKALRALRAGEAVPQVKLRKGDELTMIADALNLLLADGPRRQRQATAAPAEVGPTARPEVLVGATESQGDDDAS